MGSSSKKSSSSTAGKTAAAAAPDATATGLPGGVTQQYYSDLSKVPTTGGLVKPVAGGEGQPMQGAGLNWYTPPAASAARNTLASTISGNSGGFNDTYGRGARGMGGAYGNRSRSGRNPRGPGLY
jgi:hypothetical protein